MNTKASNKPSCAGEVQYGIAVTGSKQSSILIEYKGCKLCFGTTNFIPDANECKSQWEYLYEWGGMDATMTLQVCG